MTSNELELKGVCDQMNFDFSFRWCRKSEMNGGVRKNVQPCQATVPSTCLRAGSPKVRCVTQKPGVLNQAHFQPLEGTVTSVRKRLYFKYPRQEHLRGKTP